MKKSSFLITNQAKGYGFFPVWMMVYEDEPEIKRALIDTFPGTAVDCFDESGAPVKRKGSDL